MPYAVQLFIGRRLGDLMFGLLARRRQIARRNLELCFPELEADVRHRLLRSCLQSVGISVMEAAFSWWGSETRLQNLYRLEGEEHLQDALEQGKGVLLLGERNGQGETGQLQRFEKPYHYHHRRRTVSA